MPFAAQVAATQNIPGSPQGQAPEPVYAAAKRLAALPATARHDWLAAHLAVLRAGGLTLGQVP
jgi:hypothetical protein